MAAHRKTYDARLMTVLVQIGAGVSGAIALAALVVALWPNADTSILPSEGESVMQELQVEIATPYVPTTGLSDGVLSIEGQKPMPDLEIPGVTTPRPY